MTSSPGQRPFHLESKKLLFTLLALLAFASASAGDLALPSRTSIDDGTWSVVPNLAARSVHTAIYDPVRDRVIAFGGRDSEDLRNDVWVLPLAEAPLTWQRLAVSGEPPAARGEHTAVYDPVRDRMIVFGGYGAASSLDDTWALELSGTPSWVHLTPAGQPPSARYGHAAIYDAPRDRMVVFGGYDGAHRNDVWALDLTGTTAWAQLTPGGVSPSPRFHHTAIADASAGRMIVFGGWDGSYRNDVWALSLDSPGWNLLSPSGTLPSGRFGHSAVFDPAAGCMFVYGGSTPDGITSEAWSLSLSGPPSWQALQPSSTPPARYEHAAVLDPLRERMIAFAGSDGVLRTDCWALSLGENPAWSDLAPSSIAPARRAGHSAIYQSTAARMIVFGGQLDTGEANDTYWNAASAPSIWHAVEAAGTRPPARYGHTAVYDSTHERMIVFGGRTASAVYNDVWSLSLTESPGWAQLAPSGQAPFARYGHSAIYDPLRDRMIVFGGFYGDVLNDIWELTLSGTPAWRRIWPAGTPPAARMGHSAIYDPVRDRLIVFGGRISGARVNDVWALTLSEPMTWTHLAPAGTPPAARSGQSAIYDPVRDRMIVFGGENVTLWGDVWSLALADPPEWSSLAPEGIAPAARKSHSAVYDAAADLMIVFGGDRGVLSQERWTLDWSAPLGVPDPSRPGAVAFLANRPNPFGSLTTIEIVTNEPATGSLRIFDVRGRLVRTLFANGTLSPGKNPVAWDGRDETGSFAASGPYYLRFETKGQKIAKRILLLR